MARGAPSGRKNKCACQPRDPADDGAQRTAVKVRPELRAVATRPAVKIAVSAVVLVRIDRCVEIIGARRIFSLAGLLRIEAVTRQIAVEERRCKLVAHNGFHRGCANVDFAAIVMRGPIDGARAHLRFKDGRYRLRLAG